MDLKSLLIQKALAAAKHVIDPTQALVDWGVAEPMPQGKGISPLKIEELQNISVMDRFKRGLGLDGTKKPAKVYGTWAKESRK